MKAMILAAGMGTRLQPLTNAIPKALLKVRNRPLLEYIILKLKNNGVNEIIVNVHHHADQLIEFLKSKNCYDIRIEVSDETENLLDTGGGIKKAYWFFDDAKPFFVYAVDVLTDIDLKDMMQFHKKHRQLVTLAIKSRKTSRNLLVDSKMKLIGWKNNQTDELIITRDDIGKYIPTAFSGIHILSPGIFKLMNEDGPFSITSFYLRMATSHDIYCYEHNKTEWYEFGRIDNLKQLDRHKDIDKFLV